MKDRNRYKEIYQTIPEGCNRQSQPYTKMAETPDKDTWGWLTAEMPESCGWQLWGWVGVDIRTWINKIKNHPEVSLLRIFHFLSKIREKTLLITTQEAGDPEINSGWSYCIRAFTLIELLVVVLIIGILAAVAIPQYQVAVDKAKISTLLPVMRHVKELEELYKINNGKYTLNWEELGADLPYTSISSDKSTIYVEKKSFSLSSEGTFWHVNGSIREGTAYLYLALGTKSLFWLCYPNGSDRGRRLCRNLGCVNVNSTSCSFAL